MNSSDVLKILGLPGFCTVCRKPEPINAIFEPNEALAKRIGQPTGKKRFIACTVCVHCIEKGTAGKLSTPKWMPGS